MPPSVAAEWSDGKDYQLFKTTAPCSKIKRWTRIFELASHMSYNRNPTGKNQHGAVLKASDPVLQGALQKYHGEGITNDDKISARLLKEYTIVMKPATIKRRRKELGLLSARYATTDLTYEQKAQLVLDILDQDLADGFGVDNVRYRIAKKNLIHLSRDFVADVMHAVAPEGFAKREPGARRIIRVPKAPIGIHERWSADGHDKLNSIGFPIWAIVDDATGKWLGAWVVPSNRTANIVAYLFLDLVEQYGGLPLQTTTDCGSETTVIYGLANALREEFHPDIDPVLLPAHNYVRSVHNISVERSWLRLRLDWGNNAVLAFHEGINQGIYNPSDAKQYELVQFLWSKLLRQELAAFIDFRNGVRMRKDNEKAGPSGMSRNDAFSLPESWGGKDCLLPFDTQHIAFLKEALGGESILEFVSADYAQRAEAAYESLGIMTITMENVWTVFKDLFRELHGDV